MSSSKEDSNTVFFYSDPQINQVSNLDWLWQIFKHRDASIRIMGYQMASIIATSEQGASLLIRNQALEMWTQFMEIVLDRIESYQVKDYAMRTLTHLLRLGTNRNSTWYGPIFQERISGLKLNGEASLLPFLGSINFEESIARYFRAFSSYHHPKSSTWSSHVFTNPEILNFFVIVCEKIGLSVKKMLVMLASFNLF